MRTLCWVTRCSKRPKAAFACVKRLLKNQDDIGGAIKKLLACDRRSLWL